MRQPLLEVNEPQPQYGTASLVAPASSHGPGGPAVDAENPRASFQDKTGTYTEHGLSSSDVAALVQTHFYAHNPFGSPGLSSEDARLRLEQSGPNVLPPPLKKPNWQIFLEHVLSPLELLLLMAGVLSLCTYAVYPTEYQDLDVGILLFVVVLGTAFASFYQELSASEVMESLKVMMPVSCPVQRDGAKVEIPTSDIVVGDLVFIRTGDKVGADMRVVYGIGMKVDQSMITGEAEPQLKLEEQEDASGEALEARCLAFSGSLCVEGEGLGIVIRTGADTLIGSLASLSTAEDFPSTLQVEITRFVQIVTVLSIFMAATVFVVGMSTGKTFMESFMFGFLVVIVANVPQGLPATVTSCLAIVAKRMIEKNVYVKRLDMIETLGSVSVICSDKTGTLTENLMSVAHVWCAEHRYTRSTFPQSEASVEPLQLMSSIIMLNSRVTVLPADFTSSSTGLSGDATELGLYRFVAMFKDVEPYRASNPKVFEIPFSSASKWQLSIHVQRESGGQVYHTLLMKGAADIVMRFCSYYVSSDGSQRPLSDTFTTSVDREMYAFGSNSERVLGFAMLRLPYLIDENSSLDPSFADYVRENFLKGLTFVGLVSLADPPRKEVPGAITMCHEAGIKVVMVTGDHPTTAAAIAAAIGIISNSSIEGTLKGITGDPVKMSDRSVVVHGNKIDTLTDKEWDAILSKDGIVFARTSPKQKLTIVKKIQALGAVVAMTGDGVNDSPALSRADVGIAMGISGSDVAREAADIVLLDDNFASILAGVCEGRLLFDNLRKTIAYTLAHLLPEIVPSIMYFFFDMPLGLSCLLVLTIDLFTELGPAISFAYEYPEAVIMKLPPRNMAKDRLVSNALLSYSYLQAGVIESISCLVAYFAVFWYYGLSPSTLVGLASDYFSTSSTNDTLTIGDLTLDHEEQMNIIYRVQTAYYMVLVLSQVSHVWMCRTRTSSIFTHGIFSNTATNVGVCLEVCILIFIVYTPGVTDITHTRNIQAVFLLPALISWVCLWSWNEFRKFCTRNYPGGVIDRLYGW